ncbi:Cleavage and polyadenylation specificity factor subunit 4, partial [Opisthocomus hoazin]
MQEIVAGVEKIRLGLEADAEQWRGAWPLPFPGTDKLGVAVCKLLHPGLRTKGECQEGMGMAPTPPCKTPGTPGSWSSPSLLCDQPVPGCFVALQPVAGGCWGGAEYDVTKLPDCYFYSKFGECSNKDCPFLHIDATTMGCPWYDRGFCRHGPRCKYKHTRRVMCPNYLVGFCPEGPQCKFMHLKAGMMMSSTNPAKGAGCPWGLARLHLGAGKQSGRKDVPCTEPPLPVTSATQDLAAQLWDTGSCPQDPQSLLQGGICFK